MIRDPSDGSVKQQPAGYTALKAKHGETWGIKQPESQPRAPFKTMSAKELEEHYAKHNLGFEPKGDDHG